MARLNEPLAATESIETLRRKFLRQNRDIARINSTQSLRIRALENENARMLSQNLDLRGQILRLETELRESRAQRIADHALQIKEKMEAQLLEWGEMLASLGNEPIPRNRSPRAAKKPRLSRESSFQYRRRNPEELEAAAVQEGRLPPLWENRSYPRESLSRDELLALWEEDAETDNSPELGPPPVSRFVDEEAVKMNLPRKTTLEAFYASDLDMPEETLARNSNTEQDEEVRTTDSTSDPGEARSVKPARPAASQMTADSTKAGHKRKVREDDEKENVRAARGVVSSFAKGQAEKFNIANRAVNRPIKVLSSGRRDVHEKAKPAPVLAARRPLSAKTTNELVNSPKKSSKSTVDEIAKAKEELKQTDTSKNRLKGKKKEGSKNNEASIIEIATAEPASTTLVASIEVVPTGSGIDEDGPSAEPDLSAPASPDTRGSSQEECRDTPPPADLSSIGETIRASRRSRPHISYAEPNLRDKMRRPTKQLFDAVAGEGKSWRRVSTSMTDDPSSAVKIEEGTESWKKLPSADSTAAEAPTSPLARKSRSSPVDEEFPASTHVTDRRKRNSTISVEAEDGMTLGKSTSKKLNRHLQEIATREAEAAKMPEEPDIYDFTSSSPSNSKHSVSGEGSKKASSHTRQTKGKRLPSEETGSETSQKPTRATHGRRGRASMFVTKSSSMDAENEEDNSLTSMSSAETDENGSSVGDRVSTRRRSMML